MGVFEIIGPSMVGPSSSHTAGACRIGYAALRLLDETPNRATIHLHGSFLATGAGHGTREALAAGLLGMAPDDERLIHARLNLTGPTRSLSLTAASVGGGSVLLQEIDGQPVEIHGTLETLVLWHHDTPGFLARVTAVLACVQVNVATIRTSRSERGETAITSIEVDGQLPAEVSALLRKTPAITRLAVLAPLPGF